MTNTIIETIITKKESGLRVIGEIESEKWTYDSQGQEIAYEKVICIEVAEIGGAQ